MEPRFLNVRVILAKSFARIDVYKRQCVIFPNAHKSNLGNYSGVAVNLKYINETGSFPEEEPERIPAGTKLSLIHI